jgi:hypothetical protein
VTRLARNGGQVLLLFTKRPEPGRAKTRLIPALGAEGACEVHARLARHAAGVVRAVDACCLRRVACVSPDAWTAEAPSLLGPGLEVWPQGDGDLGARMARAFERAFAEGAARVIVVGSDCPDLRPELIERAFHALTTHDACFGPAADGGYYLLGLARPMPGVFEDVPWSDPKTGRVTLERLEAERAWVHRLVELRDVDSPEDLEQLRARWQELLEPGGGVR